MYEENIKLELKKRWSKIYDLMDKNSVDALLVSTNTNILYATSRVINGYCYFDRNNDKPIYFVRRPLGLEGENVVYIRKVEDIAQYIKETPKNIALELDSAPYSEIIRYSNVFKEVPILNASMILRSARTIKTEYELSQVRESGILHTKSYNELSSIYKEGMSDIEFSIEAERIMRNNGSLGQFRIAGSSMEIFFGSILSGDNADNPSPYDFAMGGAGQHNSLPVGANGSILKEGTSLMVDLGGNFTGYMSDMTRTFSIGKLSDLAYKAHDTSIKICREFESMAKPGVKAADIYNMALSIAADANLDEYFMGYKQKAAFVGHGLGLEINEQPVLAPRSKDIFEKDMTVALEPKFVIPSIGAVGIENTYIINDNGVECVTNFREEIIDLK